MEAYTKEGIKSRRFPGIAFRGEDYRRRAWVVGAGLDVWEIVALMRDFGSAQALASDYEITEGQIRLASSYAETYPDEIEPLIARGRPTEAEALARYPFLTTHELAVSSGKA